MRVVILLCGDWAQPIICKLSLHTIEYSDPHNFMLSEGENILRKTCTHILPVQSSICMLGNLSHFFLIVFIVIVPVYLYQGFLNLINKWVWD